VATLINHHLHVKPRMTREPGRPDGEILSGGEQYGTCVVAPFWRLQI